MSIPLESILMIIIIIDDTDSWFHNGLILKQKCWLSEMYVMASERQDRAKCQDNRDRRKYQAKPEEMLRRHSFNQSRKL